MKNILIILVAALVSVNVLTSFNSKFTNNPFLGLIKKSEVPTLSQPDMQKAIALLSQKKWDQAIKLLVGFTSDYPTNGESWYYLASAYHGKKDYVNAIKSNQQAIKYARKERANAYYNLACAYSLNNNKNEAYTALNSALQNGFLNFDLLRDDKDIELLRKSGLIELPKKHQYQKIKAHNGIEIKYNVILPEDYKRSKTYPAMLAYPPGSQQETSADWAISEFWGTRAKTKGWIIIIPVAPSNGWINHPSHHALNDLLKRVKENHNIEGGKFHMVGFEGGARPAATFALMSKQYFQSLTTISSHAWERWDDDDLESFKIMPVKLIVGENDEHGVKIAKHVQKSFIEYNVKSHLEIIPNEGRSLPSLRNANVIDILERSIL